MYNLFSPLSLFLLILSCFGLTAAPALASESNAVGDHFVTDWTGIVVVALFLIAYLFVLLEEKIHLRKSKPVTIAAGLIWMIVLYDYSLEGKTPEAHRLIEHNLLEYAQMLLFLLSAMTYINALEERRLFQALRSKLISAGLSFRQLFWACGGLAFILSPVADNLTTALVLGAVTLAVGGEYKKFVVASCINVVIAANAGGAFSPFGDITTLMVWQKGVVHFADFFTLFLPSLVSWLIPAFVMSLTIPKILPEAPERKTRIKKGGLVIAILFLSTIAMTVILHQFFHLPPFLGMMTGLGFLKVYGFFIRQRELRSLPGVWASDQEKPFDIFVSLSRIEWDTLMFFYGVMMCVGGLGAMGYLDVISRGLYGHLGDTGAHTFIGVLSAIIDNIPVMFAVLSMEQSHSVGQWLLVTLTAGIGGSLLSIGSAAGVALMGQARGVYTFSSHLKWTWIIAVGYLAGIGTHLLLNASEF